MNLSVAAMCRILGIKPPIPLSPAEMARSLRVAFYPNVFRSVILTRFLEILRLCLINAGVEVLTYEEALAEGTNGKIGQGIVLFAPGEGEAGNLAIDHVASLSKNTVVGVLDGTVPGIGEGRLQKRVDALVSALVWHMAHVIIYVDDSSWTVCNMNGAIDTFSNDSLEHGVLCSLIPKLAAPVVPPQKGDFEVHEDGFDSTAPEYGTHVDDMVAGAAMWGKTGLLASQTKLAELAFRNNRYRRIAGAYLSWRTGMSYGFLARQLPVAIKAAMHLDEGPQILRLLDWSEKDFYELDNHICVVLKLNGQRLLVRVPQVSVLCTRSGCEKISLDPKSDLTKLDLREGRIIVETPTGLNQNGDCQPSFDTTTILAHAVGNAIVASVLQKMRPSSEFCTILRREGLALAHWHGFLHSAEVPAGYYLYGRSNPPVSCSTPQAAIYALAGKLTALEKSLKDGAEYLGDLHEEPSHGTNLIGKSLVELAHLAAGAAV